MTAVTALALTPSTIEYPLHTISVLVRNQPGVLVRVCLVFARRGYNIESLVVSPGVTDREFSRITITCRGEPATLEQIIKQLAKLIDVVRAIDHTGQDAVETEIALVKVRCAGEARREVLQIIEHYKAKVVDYKADSLIVQIAGVTPKLDNFIQLVTPLGIVELVRSGKLIMARGSDVT